MKDILIGETIGLNNPMWPGKIFKTMARFEGEEACIVTDERRTPTIVDARKAHSEKLTEYFNYRFSNLGCA